jgi:PAS domain S-box-containing protein
VDDEVILLEVAKEYLEEYGQVTVDTSLSADEALVRMEGQEYDAIVSDYQMPGTDGLQFLRRVRQEHGAVPFILFTGKGREDVAALAFELGVDFYVQKGGDPAAQFGELMHKVRSAMESRRLAAELAEQEEMLEEAEKLAELGNWSLDFQTGHMHFSRSMYKIMDEMEGTPIGGDLFPRKLGPEMSGFIDSLLRDAISQRQHMISYDYTFNGTDGRIRYHHTNALIRYQADGRPERMVCITQDVTMMLRAQKGMAEAKKLNDIINCLGDMLFILDQEGMVLHANMAAERRLGFALVEMKDKPFAHIHPPGMEAALKECLEELLRGKKELCYAPLVTRDGTVIQAETRVSKGRWNGLPVLICLSREIGAERERFLNGPGH